MVAGQLVTRLVKREHQSKILAKTNTLTIVEQKFHRLISLETTDISTHHLRSSLSSHLTFNSLRSKRKRLQGEDTLKIPRNNPCNGCGKTLHSNGLKGRKNCPSRTFRCRNCGVIGHLEKVCRKPKMVPTTESTSSSTGHQSKILCNKKKENQASYEQRWGLPPIPYLTWINGRFQRSPLEPPPSLKIEVSLIPESHAKFGRTLDNRGYCRTLHIYTIEDTVAKTCSSGLKILEVLGCTSSILIPNSHRIRRFTNYILKV